MRVLIILILLAVSGCRDNFYSKHPDTDCFQSRLECNSQMECERRHAEYKLDGC
jgi:hypothetical protein